MSLIGLQGGAMALTKKTQFPGFSNKQVSNLFKKSQEIDDEEERKKFQYETYIKALPIVVAKSKLEERQEAKKEMAYQSQLEKDEQKKKSMQLTLRMADFADVVREDALKKGTNLADVSDDELIGKILPQIPQGETLMENYLNNGDEEIFNVTQLKQQPTQGGVIEEEADDKKRMEIDTDGELGFMGNLLSSAIMQVPTMIANQGAWIENQIDKGLDFLLGTELEGKGRELTEQLSEKGLPSIEGGELYEETMERIGVDPNSVSAKGGRIVAEIANIALTRGGSTKDFAKNFPKLWKVIAPAVRNVIDMNKLTIGSEERMATVGEAGFSAALPVGGKMIGALRKSVPEGMKWMMGTISGKGKAAIDETFKKAGISKEFKEGLKGDVDIIAFTNTIKRAFQNMQKQTKSVFGSFYNKLRKDTSKIDKGGLGEMVNTAIKKTRDPDALKSLNTLEELIKTRDDVTPYGMHELKQVVYNTMPSNANNYTKSVFNSIYGEIKKNISKAVPEYAEKSKQYDLLLQHLRAVEDAAGAGNKVKTQTAINKIFSIFKDNKQFSKTMLDDLNKYAEEDIVAKTLGIKMAEVFPEGTIQKFLVGGGGFFGLSTLNPAFLGILSGSPRLIAEFAGILNISKKKLTDLIQKVGLDKAGKFIKPITDKTKQPGTIVGTKEILN